MASSREHMQHRWSAFVIASTLAACGGKASSFDPAPKSAPTAADLAPLCDRYYARQRECVEPYLEALLDVRLEYDQPPGIVAEVAAQGREAVMAGVRADWEAFTTLEATARICAAMPEATPAERVAELHAEGEACLAAADCDAYARCAIETERTYIQSGDQH